MPSASKKQRHAAKRKAKRLEIRRRESVSPIKRLASAPGMFECWMSDDFQEFGQASIFVYKQAGRFGGVACFLIDRGVVGLKDAYVLVDIDRTELEDMLEVVNERGIPLKHASIDQIRPWIAGAIRWTRENKMRLPKHFGDAASFIGGVGDIAAADLSPFVKEFAGHPDDLRQRLIGEPFETYIRRQDIDFVFSDDAPCMNQRTGQYDDAELTEEDLEMLEAMAEMPKEGINELADRLHPLAGALAKQTSAWLAQHGETPSDQLYQAWQSVILASLLSKAAAPDATAEQLEEHCLSLLDDMACRLDRIDPGEHRQAVRQVMQHMKEDSSLMPKAFMKHGLPPELTDSADESE